jgi:predicted CopG family antitoxin
MPRKAYHRLKRVKRDRESLSQTIKRVVPKPIDFKRWMASIEKDPLSDQAVKAVEAVVSQRRSRLRQVPYPRGSAAN